MTAAGTADGIPDDGVTLSGAQARVSASVDRLVLRLLAIRERALSDAGFAVVAESLLLQCAEELAEDTHHTAG